MRSHSQRPVRSQAVRGGDGGSHEGKGKDAGKPYLLPGLPGEGFPGNPTILRSHRIQFLESVGAVRQTGKGDREKHRPAYQSGVLHPGGPCHLRPLRPRLQAGRDPGWLPAGIVPGQRGIVLAGRAALSYAL